MESKKIIYCGCMPDTIKPELANLTLEEFERKYNASAKDFDTKRDVRLGTIERIRKKIRMNEISLIELKISLIDLERLKKDYGVMG